MRLYEYEGADIFRREGLPAPDSALAARPVEAREKARIIGLPVVVKAQVLTGGRWLAGGVHTSDTLDDVEETAGRIIGSTIRGLPVESVMVARKVEGEREYYLSISVDDYNGVPVAILSAEGGVAINTTAKKQPEVVVTHPLLISEGLPHSEAKRMCREAGLSSIEQTGVAPLLFALYQAFRKYDAFVAEINR